MSTSTPDDSILSEQPQWTETQGGEMEKVQGEHVVGSQIAESLECQSDVSLKRSSYCHNRMETELGQMFPDRRGASLGQEGQCVGVLVSQ